jgi:hypothetical protein
VRRGGGHFCWVGDLVRDGWRRGLGEDVPPEERTFWHATYQKNHTGDTGRKRVRISSINCVTATACTSGSTACDARSYGCTAPKTRSDVNTATAEFINRWK